MAKTTMIESDLLDFMRLVVHKPLANELKLLLDKYKTVDDRLSAIEFRLFLLSIRPISIVSMLRTQARKPSDRVSMKWPRR